MQIVIDIDENVFTRLFDNGIQDNEIAIDDICEMAKSIRNGVSISEFLEELKRKILMEVDGGTDDRYLRYADVCDRISNSIDEYKTESEDKGMNCKDCILDGTDACSRGAGRAIDDEPCGDFIGTESEDKE